MKIPRLGLGGWIGIGAGGLLLLLLATLLLDWNLLRHPIERFASSRSGRAVRVQGALEVHPWSLSPAVSLKGLTVGNPPWESGPPLLQVEQLHARLELLPLLRGEVILARLELIHPQLYLHQDKEGRANWTFENQKPTNAPAAAPPRLPVVRNLLIQDGTLALLDDVRQLKAQGTVQAHERESAQAPRPFRLKGKGTINKEPFALEAAGGALQGLTPQHPYPFDLAVTAGDNHIKATGRVLKPFDLGGLDLDVEATGNDLAELYYLTRLALPNTPPYSVRAHVVRRGQRVAVTDIQGKLGDSDLAGTANVDTSRKRPAISGDLSSQHLRVADAVAVFGGRASSAGALEPRAIAKTRARDQTPPPPLPLRVFPDAPLQVERVRDMDADMRIRARQIDAGSVPITEVALHVILKEGVLSIDPFALEMPQGHFAGAARIDARGAVPQVRIDVRARDVELQQLKGKGPAAAPPLTGELQARAVIEGSGDSVHKVLADARGGLTVILPHGEVRAAFAELAGIDVAEGVGLLLKGDEQTEVRCGVAQFAIEDGTLHAQHVVVDTKNVLIRGGGDARLGSEELDLSLKGDPKKPRLVRLRTPIEIRGHFRKPEIGINAGGALKQGAIAAAVAAVATPLAAIFAFVDPGLAKDQNCATLLAEAGDQARQSTLPPISQR
jgi:uncharacterized protein involved in outer membrane biogenesis